MLPWTRPLSRAHRATLPLRHSSQYVRSQHQSISLPPTAIGTEDHVLKVLGIETSCDDTAVAVVTSDKKILSERIHRQTSLHEPLGGVHPLVAAISHAKQLPHLVVGVLADAGLTLDDLDAIAVTRGPGLSACLSVGTNSANMLAALAQKTLVGVHHMEAHALTARFSSAVPPTFPFLCLLISGGHTLILLARDVNDYQILATTNDDSVGEAFDKTARHLRIPWLRDVGGAAGAALEQEAAKSKSPDRFRFTVPLSRNKGKSDLIFSFSGLKTSVIVELEREKADLSDPDVVADASAAFQFAATEHLVQKLEMAIRLCKNEGETAIRHLVISGGVACNSYIRTRLIALACKFNLEAVLPPPQLCTDNGVMIAWAGIERLRRGLSDETGFQQLSRWNIGTLRSSSSPSRIKTTTKPSTSD